LSDTVLVIGGARSGKSRYAQGLLAASRREPLLIATGEAGDAEMAARIAAHRAERPAHWRTIEEPLALASTIDSWAAPERVVLVDCVTLWLSNLYMAARDAAAESEGLVAAISRAAGPVILVSNEVGLGIVPDNALARAFRDAQGRLNQQLAACCGKVVLVSAGLPLLLKPAAVPILNV